MEDSITVSNFPVLIADINYLSGDVCDTITGIISGTNLNNGDILLYPNPVTANHVNIQYRLPEKITGKVEIYDITGNTLHLSEFNNDKNIIELNLNNFAKGLYIYKIYINNKLLKTDKLMIE